MKARRESRGKGYQFEDFEDTFRRYIPKSEVEALKADLATRVVNKGEQEKPDQVNGGRVGGDRTAGFPNLKILQLD